MEAATGAGGFSRRVMCDIRLGSTQPRLPELFVNAGPVPGDGGAWFLQRVRRYGNARPED